MAATLLSPLQGRVGTDEDKEAVKIGTSLGKSSLTEMESDLAAIDGLKPKARKVVEMHQMQEHSLKETAQVLGISAAAAKARMFHARAALRRMPLLKSMGGSNWASAG